MYKMWLIALFFRNNTISYLNSRFGVNSSKGSWPLVVK